VSLRVATLLLCCSSAAAAQSLQRVYVERFERPGPPPYEGWSQLVDESHPAYNPAGVVSWDARDDVVVTLRDGRRLSGRIIIDTPAEVRLQTPGGKVVVLAPAEIAARASDESRRPRSGERAAAIRCFRGAGAFQTRLGALTDERGAPMPVDAGFAYELRAWVKMVRNRQDAAFIALRWLDITGTELSLDRSAPLARAPDWTPLILEVSRIDPRARYVQLVLSLEGPDVDAECLFDDVELVAQPRIRIETPDRSYFMARAGRPIEADVSFGAGLPGGTRLLVRASDLYGKEAAPEVAFAEGSASERAPARFAFTPARPGYYRIQAQLVGADGTSVARAWAPVLSLGSLGEGGGGRELGLIVNPYTTPYLKLRDLIQRLGVRQVKIVLWDQGVPRGGLAPSLDQLARLVEEVWTLDEVPQVTGVLGRGPEFLFRGSAAGGTLLAHPLALFARPRSEWERPLVQTLSKLNRVGDWQIGTDFETSAAPPTGAADAFGAAAGAIRAQDRSYSKIGLPASLRSPVAMPPGGDFFAFLADDPAAPAPIPRRAGDHLVLRLEPRMDDSGEAWEAVTARMIQTVARLRGRAELPWPVFLPLEDLAGRGLLTADGWPQPPLAAFPVLDELLAGASPDPTLRLFDGAQEAIFDKGPYAVVVAWADKPEAEPRAVYAGDEARRADAFGQVARLAPGEPVRLGPLPIYLDRVDKALIRTQSDVRFDPQVLKLQRRDEQNLVKVTLKNRFAQPMRNVGIRLGTRLPGWSIEPAVVPSIDSIEPEAESPARLVRLRPSAASGAGGRAPIDVSLSFTVGMRDYAFTVRRDLALEWVVQPRLKVEPQADGSVVVSVWLKNLTTSAQTVQVTTVLPDRPPRPRTVTVPGRSETDPPERFVVLDARRWAGREAEVFVFQPDDARAAGREAAPLWPTGK
jgi:hypothetical protein